MSTIITASIDCKVLRPGKTLRWQIELRAKGTAAGNRLLNISASSNIHPQQRTVRTDANGKASIEVRAVALGKATIEVRYGKTTKWHGCVFVSDVDITAPGLALSPSDLELMKMLLWKADEVTVLCQFGSGQSGNRVFLVHQNDDQGPFLRQIVKIGFRDEILQEEKNYQLFRNRVPSAAAISGIAQCGVQAAILYRDASAAEALEPFMPLAEYFRSAKIGSSELQSTLYSVLGIGLRKVHSWFHVRDCSPREAVGRWLPENLVANIGGGRGLSGIFPTDDTRLCPTAAWELDPDSVENRAGNHDDIELGDVVLLRGFRVAKVQTQDLILEDADAKKYRIKVRFDGANVNGIEVGQTVDVVARFVADRARRMEFAVQHCLKTNGFWDQEGSYGLEREVYPDPLKLLQSILDSRMEIAWATIHGDLHWENIMLEGPTNWCLIDYGLSRKGPVLYDFIKLETYLRMTILARDQDITPGEVLAFEGDLLINPFGDLPPKPHSREILNKAATAIRSIRRLARPYMLNGYKGYRDLLFCYAVATVKYYPAKDRWRRAAKKGKIARELQRSSRGIFFVLASALSLGRAIESERITGEFPNLRLEFVPMGSVLQPKEGQVVLDVGNRLESGMVDHHQNSDGKPNSATSLVWTLPHLILDSRACQSPNGVTWVTHEHPDFDAVASLFLAWHLMKCGFFPPGADQLQQYSLRVDMGDDLVDRATFPARTPYALFMAAVGRVEAMNYSSADHRERLRNGWKVITFLCQSEANGLHALARNECPHEHGFWRLHLENDENIFLHADAQLDGKAPDVNLPVRGRPEPFRLLTIREPRSLLFKVWARRHGYLLTVVQWLMPGKPDNFVIISVPAGYTNALKGLGEALEVAENAKRLNLPGKQRTGPGRYPDVNNDDPWYDGRSPTHSYTIVAAPRMGTVLSMEEIVEIVKSPNWH